VPSSTEITFILKGKSAYSLFIGALNSQRTQTTTALPSQVTLWSLANHSSYPTHCSVLPLWFTTICHSALAVSTRSAVNTQLSGANRGHGIQLDALSVNCKQQYSQGKISSLTVVYR